MLIAIGALACYRADVRNDAAWVGHGGRGNAFIAEIRGEVVAKANSWKAEAKLRYCFRNGRWEEVHGGAVLYFRKDGSPAPRPGDRIQATAALQEIRNSGNPGSFDYQRWSLFQGITHQAYLQQYQLLPGRAVQPLQTLLGTTRGWVLRCLRRYLPDSKAQGLAEALLIGYKNDLDKELNNTYARTGVVHIIAISGMHLALVYVLLLGVTIPLSAPRRRLLRLVVVLGGLWAFSLLAGGGPSVLRSALMFSLLAIGGLIGRKGDALNSLLLAALLLLVIDPFWLWDVGFQLSFTAVGGIILFYRPIYQRYSTHNKLLDAVWKGAAVSLAAQVLTTPLSLYQFHQFPLLFLLANLVAVPLSGIIVYGLIAVCALSFWPAAAALAGSICTLLIRALNGWIERIDALPFGLWDGLSITALQALLLYGLIGTVAWALLRQRPRLLRASLGCGLLVLGLRAWSFFDAGRQERLLVYQVPHLSAIELQQGRRFYYRGDEAPLTSAALYNFHLKPAHTLARSRGEAGALPGLFRFGGRTVALVSGPARPAIPIDLLIVSKGARAGEVSLEGCGVATVVLDASVSRGEARRWKTRCAELHLACHDVSEQGAFVLGR
ncbi:ComEC/Rec2 family competence protein [Flaviaesturariibacter terrae]